MAEWLKQLRNPPAAYRAAPFWAWNAKLDAGELVRQVDEMQRGGMGGFFMHVRYGLETEYMSPEFLDCIKAVVAAARKKKMEAWLYDEDRWPSGFAGGEVTVEDKNRIKYLALDEVPADQFAGPPDDAIRCFTAIVEDRVARDVRPLPLGQKPAPGTTVLVYRSGASGDVGWFNNQGYLDTMSVEAVRDFINATHEVYKREIGEEFGKTIPGIFTDEPNIGMFGRDPGSRQGRWSWASNMAAEFRRRFGYDLLERLPAISHELESPDALRVRHDYHQLCTELYTEAFSKQLGDWCAANNLELTGHELHEESLPGQINQVGACMPHYEHFQRPGIDILMDREPEVLTAKQCVSVASQMGRPRVLSELYGCTGWDATFEMYKHIGDWHQVLGVNHFCPHLSWYSMAGGAKRDYPAGMFYQSPWWEDYSLLNGYFGRLSLALSQGQPVREVLVVHPVETAWAVHSKRDQSSSAAYDASLKRLCLDLLDSQLDFDFADESMLPRFGSIVPAGDDAPARLAVGKMSYRAVVVPESLTLRKSTMELLEKFADAGGLVVFVGRTPELVDCMPSDRPGRLAARTRHVPVGDESLKQALGPACRPVKIAARYNCYPRPTCWTHLRNTDEGEVLFVHYRDRERSAWVTVEWAGQGRLREIDLISGKITDVAGVETVDGGQKFALRLHPTDAKLYLRQPGKAVAKKTPSPRQEMARVRLAGEWDYALDEPNAMNLDYCRMRVLGEGGDKGWRERKLIWKHERDLRRQLGFRDNSVPAEQPYVWLKNLSARRAQVELEFTVPAEAVPAGPLSLAIEHPERFEITVNGKRVPSKSAGWFIDRSFEVVPLRGVKFVKGQNTIRLRTEYREHHWLEEVYLTGKFGVRAAGEQMVLTTLPKKLAIGDWVGQGLAMFSGGVTYRQSVRLPKLERGQRAVLRIDRPKATVLRVAINGKSAGLLGWQPWELDVTELVKPGAANRVELTLVSSRRNLLGPLHHFEQHTLWTGPSEFRTEKPHNSRPDYSLAPYGLLGEVYVSIEQ